MSELIAKWRKMCHTPEVCDNGSMIPSHCDECGWDGQIAWGEYRGRVMKKEEAQACRSWWIYRTPIGVGGEPLPPRIRRNWFPVVFFINGKTEKFEVVSNDETITRKEAIEFCQLVLSGNFRIHYYDLSSLSR